MKRITIIGGGPGGYTAAFAAARAGAKVTLIESAAMGGTCLNTGCIPTKTIKASADAFETAHRLAEFGINGMGGAQVDMAAVIARKERVSGVLRTGLEKSCAALKITLLRGTASIEHAGLVSVDLSTGEQITVEGDRIIIATGSSSLNLPVLPVDHKHILSSDDALTLTHVPQRLLIVGGGVIGCELAFIFRAFGTSVTIVEGQGRLLPIPSVDEEMSKLLLREAKKRGIATELNRTVSKVRVLDNGTVSATLGDSPFAALPDASKKPDSECIADAVLVTIGRVPNTEALGLKRAGVDVTSRGWIIADSRMQTSVPGIYAIGDVLGPEKIMLAHVAAVEGLCAVANCLGKEERMDYGTVPSGIFTSPEIGSVGLSETQARANGMDIKTSVFQMRELGKAQAMGEIAGVCKLICDAGSGKLLGAHIAGPHATDLIAEAALAIRMGLTAEDVASTIHAHPTLAEGIYEAALGLVHQH